MCFIFHLAATYAQYSMIPHIRDYLFPTFRLILFLYNFKSGYYFAHCNIITCTMHKKNSNIKFVNTSIKKNFVRKKEPKTLELDLG